MKKKERELEEMVKQALLGVKVPILVLDSRWHTLFPPGEKPGDVAALEKQLNNLLKRQGFLVNDLKELKMAKKKLMEGIVSGMNEVSEKADRKKENQQRLLLEIKERIEEESDELMDLPRLIKAANEELMAAGVGYCFERLENGDSELRELNKDIAQMREILKEKVGYKADLEESMDSAYSLMHALFGHEVMNIFDHKNK